MQHYETIQNWLFSYMVRISGLEGEPAGLQAEAGRYSFRLHGPSPGPGPGSGQAEKLFLGPARV